MPRTVIDRRTDEEIKRDRAAVIRERFTHNIERVTRAFEGAELETGRLTRGFDRLARAMPQKP